eukprot:CAMPEP_0202901342 /NCGR_PEP_ID=MMETSP1392-20130828/14203_1 /ASSEMBLY_ACC=CAM_ASM_000868 /TAXON_ID=225041 /ORGANISM="Chlamydomonas chlamydogama, Strain SAG 11-48b" /LENGTH=37 /DNA_ID= /DNA_START= /DNA_END= /DNA_ORIENTATION=
MAHYGIDGDAFHTLMVHGVFHGIEGLVDWKAPHVIST